MAYAVAAPTSETGQLQLSSDMILAIGSLPERQCGVRLRVNSDRVRSIHKLSVYSQRAS